MGCRGVCGGKLPDCGGYAALDHAPARAKVRIPGRQTPDGMQMVGQDHDGIEFEWPGLLYLPESLAQGIQQGGAHGAVLGHAVEGDGEALHQRIGVVLGSRDEVERIERYHADPSERGPETPLFAERSLFRD